MLSVIIPCFNEEENIKNYKKELIPAMETLTKDYEIIAVNDGSSDHTVQELESLKKKIKQLKIVSYENNRGMGYALRQGIKKARGELTVFLDSDMTFHPSQTKLLMERFNKGDVDCVIGSHFLEGGRLDKVPTYRIFLSKSVNIIYRILFGQKIKSISSIFRLYKTRDIQEMELISNGFNINAEILFKLIKKKKRVVEVPVVLTTRVFGVSKLNTKKEIVNHIKLILNILKWKITR